MDHVRKNICSTKLKQVMNTILHDLRLVSTSQDIHLNSVEGANDKQDYYAHIKDLQKIYTDQTDRFPTTSSQGSKYCFVLYSYDANAVLVEPIKSRAANEFWQICIYYFTTRCQNPPKTVSALRLYTRRCTLTMLGAVIKRKHTSAKYFNFAREPPLEKPLDFFLILFIIVFVPVYRTSL